MDSDLKRSKPRALNTRREDSTQAARDAWPADLANDLARRLIWFRRVRGYSQRKLAKRAGLSQSAVNDAESGQSQMTVRTLLLLAAALDTTPGILLGENERTSEHMGAHAARKIESDKKDKW